MLIPELQVFCPTSPLLEMFVERRILAERRWPKLRINFNFWGYPCMRWLRIFKNTENYPCIRAPCIRARLQGGPKMGSGGTFRPFKLQSCTRAHMKALFEAIKLPVGIFDRWLLTMRMSSTNFQKLNRLHFELVCGKNQFFCSSWFECALYQLGRMNVSIFMTWSIKDKFRANQSLSQS